MPPDRPNGLRNGQDPALLLRWQGGRTTIVPANDPIQSINLDRYFHSAATIFTHHPHTPHLFAVPFDARTRSVHHFGRGWQPITFNHNRIGDNSSYYSYISNQGAESRIAAPGSARWIPQLLPTWYDCEPRHATRIQAGLIGELPLLFALAAFSAPPTSQVPFLNSVARGTWHPHNQPTGRRFAYSVEPHQLC